MLIIFINLLIKCFMIMIIIYYFLMFLKFKNLFKIHQFIFNMKVIIFN